MNHIQCDRFAPARSSEQTSTYTGSCASTKPADCIDRSDLFLPLDCLITRRRQRFTAAQREGVPPLVEGRRGTAEFILRYFLLFPSTIFTSQESRKRPRILVTIDASKRRDKGESNERDGLIQGRKGRKGGEGERGERDGLIRRIRDFDESGRRLCRFRCFVRIGWQSRSFS